LRQPGRSTACDTNVNALSDSDCAVCLSSDHLKKKYFAMTARMVSASAPMCAVQFIHSIFCDSLTLFFQTQLKVSGIIILIDCSHHFLLIINQEIQIQSEAKHIKKQET
jgi:hypothetical protein